MRKLFKRRRHSENFSELSLQNYYRRTLERDLKSFKSILEKNRNFDGWGSYRRIDARITRLLLYGIEVLLGDGKTELAEGFFELAEHVAEEYASAQRLEAYPMYPMNLANVLRDLGLIAAMRRGKLDGRRLSEAARLIGQYVYEQADPEETWRSNDQFRLVEASILALLSGDARLVEKLLQHPPRPFVEVEDHAMALNHLAKSATLGKRQQLETLNQFDKLFVELRDARMNRPNINSWPYILAPLEFSLLRYVCLLGKGHEIDRDFVIRQMLDESLPN